MLTIKIDITGSADMSAKFIACRHLFVRIYLSVRGGSQSQIPHCTSRVPRSSYDDTNDSHTHSYISTLELQSKPCLSSTPPTTSVESVQLCALLLLRTHVCILGDEPSASLVNSSPRASMVGAT